MGKKDQARGKAASKYRPDPKKKKDKTTGIQQRDQDHILQDDRFSRITTDPRFRGIPNEEKKLKIDARFKSMFKDKRFDQKHTVDKRGRPVNFASSDGLKKFYHLEGSSKKKTAKSSGTDSNDGRFSGAKTTEPEEDSASESDSSDSDSDNDDNAARDLARGKGNVESSSDDSDEDSEDEDKNEAEIEHPWAEFTADAPQTEEITRRLALVNMDWDSMKAEDVFSLLNSFKPATGFIKSVTIYPSEYGLKQMEEEKKAGPLSLNGQAKANNSDDEKDSTEEDDEMSNAKGNEKLRQYQLNRMKYYYAVIECDCPETAAKIYDECDGLEYENSSTTIDLRYIPDDMEFDASPKSAATNLPANYVASEFINSALQQSTVKCSWDETARDRKGLPAVTDWEKQDDLQAYLASSSSEEDEDEPFIDTPNGDTRSVYSKRSMKDPEMVEQYRALILNLDDKEKANKSDNDSEGDIDLEVDWEPGVKSAAESAVEEKQKASKAGKLTPFEKILDKQAQKRQARRKEKARREDSPDIQSALANDDDNDDLVDSDAEEDDEESIEEDEKQDKTRDNAAQLELLVGDADDKRHFNLASLVSDAKESKTKMRKKRKLAATAKSAPTDIPDDFELDVDDPRFSALFTSSHYNVDMSDPAFKKTKAMDVLVKEKLKRRATNGTAPVTEEARHEARKIRPEISSLVKAVKAKIVTEKAERQKKMKK